MVCWEQSSCCKTQLTNCSRGIRNVWHFYYALNLVIKVVCGGLGISIFSFLGLRNSLFILSRFGFTVLETDSLVESQFCDIIIFK
ncbi:DUF3265 domain-containing protein [Vibrio alginolyticus]|nr:DUF3265 domain-containing protein [Vibrio alginolyticus]MBS9889035.1 DUF3265 domain-containing protein [Vibrio alginolyticus]QCO86283.1 DUF3265 domain-containing protein [Vibrio neocaledonicus]